MKRIFNFKKIISVITALCLLISFVIGPTAANAMTNEEATKQYKQIFKDFMLPYSYGQITSAHYAGTDRVIINIQDLHCHPKVQKNISNIIETFDKSYGVKKIYLEGAYGQVDTSWINKKSREYDIPNILDKMLETGRLTGAEYYSAISGKTDIINGLEEKEPYLENLKRFGNIIENKEKIDLILNALDESLAKLKEQYYTKRQYKLENLSNDYKEGTISPQKYYALLSKHTDRLGIDLTKYENTFTYIMLLEMQKRLDYSKITDELQNLVILLRENLAQSAYQMLVDNTDNFSKMDKLYGYVIKICRQLGLDLTTNFPNLDKYFGYIEFSQKINPLELISEEELLTQEINTRFSETKAQREVVFLINFERYVKDYVSSKITSSDYEYYKENVETYRELWNKYVDNRVLNLLDEYLAEADKFYKINTDRNIYFTRNMFAGDEELNKIKTEVEANGDVNKIIENMKGVKEVDVVITGGFHSQTVTDILKNHGVSYIVITPNVTEGTKLAEDTYYKIAREQSKISFQTLANLIASLSPAAQQKIFDVLSKGKSDEKFLGLDQEIRTKKLREIIAAKLAESDDTGDVIKEVLEEMKKYGIEGLNDDFFIKVKPEVFRETWSKNAENLKNVVRTLRLGSLEQSVVLIEDTLKEQISFFTPKLSQIEEGIERKQLATKRTKEIANHYADKFGLGKTGRHILTSILAGILEFKPMMFTSDEKFLQMHDEIDRSGMTKWLGILKGIFYATSLLMITFALTTPLNIGVALSISILSGIIPHQVYDLLTPGMEEILSQTKEEYKKRIRKEIENINRHFLPETGGVKLSDSPVKVDGIKMQGVVSELKDISEEEYGKLLTTEEEQEELNKEYLKAVSIGRNKNLGGRQQGAYVDLRGYDGEIMVVGDIHGRLDKLVQKIEANKDKLASGKMIIVFNGDYVHREDNRMDEMDSSMATIQYLMRLKVLYPQNIYMIAGNHDIYKETEKKDSKQGEKFQEEWNKRYGKNDKTYENLMRQTLALAAETDKYIIVHAGPARGANIGNWRRFLRNIKEINNDSKTNTNIEYQLLWGRYKGPGSANADIINRLKNFDISGNIDSSFLDMFNKEELGVFDTKAYFDVDVDDFARNKILIVGHTHGSDADTFYRQIIPGKNVAIIEGQNDNGYGIIDQNKRFISDLRKFIDSIKNTLHKMLPNGNKVKNIIAAMLVLTAFFAGLHSMSTPNITVPYQYNQTVSSVSHEVQDTQEIHNLQKPQKQVASQRRYSTPKMERILADDNLFDLVFPTLLSNSPDFVSKDPKYWKTSFRASISDDVKDAVQEQIDAIIKKQGEPFSYDNMPEVIFLKVDKNINEYDLNTAFAITHLRMPNEAGIYDDTPDNLFRAVVIPVIYNEDGMFEIPQDRITAIAHEWTHDILDEENLPPLVEEFWTTLRGYLMLDPGEFNFTFTAYGEEYTLQFYQGMRVYCFHRIFMDQNKIIEQLKKYEQDITFSDLYYERVDFDDEYRTQDGSRFIAIELTKRYGEKLFEKDTYIYAVMDEYGNIDLHTQHGQHEFDFSEYKFVGGEKKISITQILEENKDTITEMFTGFRQDFAFSDLMFDSNNLINSPDGSAMLELYDVKNEKKDAAGNEIHVYVQMFPNGTINLLYFDKELIRSDSKGPDLPVSTQENITEQEIQEVNPETTVMGVISSVMMPVQAAVTFILSVFGKKIKIDKDTILVRSNRRADSLPENVTKVNYEINRKALSLFGGIRIGELNGKVIRVKKKGNSMIFFSKKGLEGITDSQIEDMFIQAFSAGMKNLQIKQGTRIAFAGEYTTGKQYYSEQDINDRLMNADIDAVQRAEVEISLDLSEEQNIGHSLKTKCINETSSTSTSTIILNFSQLETYLTDVIDLRNMGYRVILRGTIEDIRKAFNYGKDLHMDGAIIVKANEQNLRELETLAADNVIDTTHIETQMYADMSTAIGIDINKVYSNYGIIPIVTTEQAETVTGKYAMKFSEIKNNIKALLSEGKIINIFCSGKKDERLEDARGILADNFTNMFGTMKELLKPKSPEQRVSEEAMAVSNYNFGEAFYERQEVLVKYLLSKLQKDGNIREILTKEPAELEEFVKTQLSNEKSELYEFYKQLPPVIQKRIKKEIEKGNYFEAIGTIRGAINQIIDSSLLEHWAAGDKSYEKNQELRNNYLKEGNKEYRQYIRIRALQLAMNGNDLDALLNERPDTNMSVRQLFETIRTDLNKDVIKTIIENKYSIKTLKKEEEPGAKTNFMNINTLLEDSIIEAKVTKQLQIPVTAVRNILAAA